MSCIARNTDANFSLLRSKIRQLRPVHRETLGALLRHLSPIASRSDKGKLSRLTNAFSFAVLRLSPFSEGVIRLKVRYMNLL